MFSACIILRTSEDELMIDIYSVLTYVSFFVTICYHTIYARPWIYPALAFYALDLLLRLFRYRIKDATLTCVGNMTIVCSHHLPSECSFNDALADQHRQLRRWLGSGSTHPTPCILRRTCIRVAPAHHCQRACFHFLPRQTLYRAWRPCDGRLDSCAQPIYLRRTKAHRPWE